MAFKASKKRALKGREPIARGLQLIPSAAIRAWYEKQMRMISVSMIDDYKKEINKALNIHTVKKFYSQDASSTSIMTELIDSLNRKWRKIFENFSSSVANSFTNMVDQHSKSTCNFSLSAAGVKQPLSAYSENIRHTLGASSEFNKTLITGIQKDVHEKIEKSVMLSLTSPNPEEQGVSGIERTLREVGSFSKNRISLIARDQTSKLYSSLNEERMKQNGISKFEWVHSSAGKVPRESHVKKDGMIFEINDPRLWQGKKSDQGPPGWAINCRCRAVPVID